MDSLSLEQAARSGDAAAFGALVRAWDQDLRGVAWSVARNTNATDDIMQASYESAFRGLAQFDGRSSMKTWLHAIVYRSAIDQVRYESHRLHDDLANLRTTSTPKPQPETRAIDKAELAAALETMQPDVRAMLMLTAGLGYSFDETAVIVGQARGTVASRVSRARAELQRWEADE